MSGEKFKVICQKWEESERGWGVRPDGFSLHLTDFNRARFIEAYWDEMPETAPDEYSRPSGTPYACEVDAETYAKVQASLYGLRFFEGPYPGDGGSDGWRQA